MLTYSHKKLKTKIYAKAELVYCHVRMHDD